MFTVIFDNFNLKMRRKIQLVIDQIIEGSKTSPGKNKPIPPKL